jgi:hypothetical protein
MPDIFKEVKHPINILPLNLRDGNKSLRVDTKSHVKAPSQLAFIDLHISLPGRLMPNDKGFFRWTGKVEIMSVKWTRRGAKWEGSRGMLVVDLAGPEQANTTIREGFVVNGEIHEVEVFHPECVIRQCFNCYGYGHVAKMCRGARKCGRCAAPGHETNSCPDKETSRSKCVNCKGTHAAWDARCPGREKERERAAKARATKPQRYATTGNSGERDGLLFIVLIAVK